VARSLEAMPDWLLKRSMTIAAMESTLTHRESVCSCLEELMATSPLTPRTSSQTR
jgi:hypothetical protein